MGHTVNAAELEVMAWEAEMREAILAEEFGTRAGMARLRDAERQLRAARARCQAAEALRVH